MRGLWYGLKHSAEIRQLFAEAVMGFAVAFGITGFFILNFFLRWVTP